MFREVRLLFKNLLFNFISFYILDSGLLPLLPKGTCPDPGPPESQGDSSCADA